MVVKDRAKLVMAVLALALTVVGVGQAQAAGVVGTGAPGSCTEAALDAALAGGGAVTFDCGGSPVTIALTAQKTIATNTTIDGGGLITLSGGDAVRVFYVNAGVTLDLRHLTVADGHATGGATGFGGGIWNAGTVTIAGCTFAGNSGNGTSWGGGAIYNGGTLTVTHSTFSGNSVNTIGGAIMQNNTQTATSIANSTFSANSAPDGGGGAIYVNSGAVNITHSAFTGNTAGSGGAISSGGSLTVTNSTFANNTAISLWATGGAIRADSVTVASSTFSGNTANATASAAGGAILSTYASVTNSTFSDNSAGGGIYGNYGGGIATASSGGGGALTVTNSTFSGNGAPTGGGIYNNTGTAALRNTIVANSPSGGNCSGTITDGGNNLQFPGTTCGAGIPTADPLLGPLASNGGPTETMALLGGSPAIDAANPATCPTTDQRGYLRSGTCDIGAYEFGGIDDLIFEDGFELAPLGAPSERE